MEEDDMPNEVGIGPRVFGDWGLPPPRPALHPQPMPVAVGPKVGFHAQFENVLDIGYDIHDDLVADGDDSAVDIMTMLDNIHKLFDITTNLDKANDSLRDKITRLNRKLGQYEPEAEPRGEVDMAEVEPRANAMWVDELAEVNEAMNVADEPVDAHHALVGARILNDLANANNRINEAVQLNDIARGIRRRDYDVGGGGG